MDSAWLAQSGLIVPDDLEPGEERIRLDFTAISSRHVGAIHSRFAVRHGHALYVRAKVAVSLLKLRHFHRIELAKYRARHGEDFKTQKELEAAFSVDQGAKLEKRILALEVKAEMLDAIIGGFEDITRAASREMSRRETERAPRD